ncbi:MAG: glycosyltransferase family 4 protein, partial [Chlorobi bacterium]|nr:glycosyltransferase family 4 protein [Chlorobiota bacterium]
MQNKKILIITYYWPPSGTISVYRPLKFVKYLKDNYDIIVYVPENADEEIKSVRAFNPERTAI